MSYGIHRKINKAYMFTMLKLNALIIYNWHAKLRRTNSEQK